MVVRLFVKMKSRALFLCLFWLWCQVCVSAGMQIDLYTQKFKFGQGLNMDISEKECTNVPRPWSNVTMSVDTHDRCMQFYDRKSCRGRIAVVQPFHSVHQMDLSLIDFHNVIQSISPCGIKVPTGRYVIQSVVDASILTISKLPKSQIAHVHTLPPRPFIPKAQQWEITEKQPMEYDIMPRILEANIPVTYDSEAMMKRGSFIRNVWKVESVGKGRYVFKNGRNGRCLYKSRFQTVAEIDCRAWSPNQEWVLRPLLSFQTSNFTSPAPSILQSGNDPSPPSDKNGKGKQKPVKGSSKKSTYKIISQRKNLKPSQKHVKKDTFHARSQQMVSPVRKPENGSGSEESEEDDEESDEEEEDTRSDERSRKEEREVAQDSDEDSVQRVAGFMKLLLKGVSNKMQEDERAEEEEIEVFE